MSLTDEQLQNRVKWVRALLSGEYKQGREALRVNYESGDYYCCLGVACLLIHPDSPRLELRPNMSASQALMEFHELEAFGMSATDQRYAAGWNDNNGHDFARIADLVAYATAKNLSFDKVIPDSVNSGFAVEWLKQFD